jgi:hypothetical protein
VLRVEVTYMLEVYTMKGSFVIPKICSVHARRRHKKQQKLSREERRICGATSDSLTAGTESTAKRMSLSSMQTVQSRYGVAMCTPSTTVKNL